MISRIVLASLVLVTVLAVGAAPASPVAGAEARSCYLDPDDPVPGIQCGIFPVVQCVQNRLKQCQV